MKKEKVIVAMSGGVDSSVVAALMVEKGYDVTGVTLKFFDGDNKFIEDAKNVAKQLGIKWYVADYSDEFKNVISYFINSYRKGETPNPCSFCNRNAKTVFLFNEMQKNGAKKIVTGHYAKVKQVDGVSYIAKAKNIKKDQSYYLALLDRFQIGLLLLPHGDVCSKDEIRKMAEKFGLKVAEKKDSQEVCFLTGLDYREFLKEKVGAKKFKKGFFYYKGKKIGKHEGIELFTIGQRRGLGLSYHEPLYVERIDPISGNIYLTDKEGVYKRGVKLKNTNFINERKRVFKAKVKLRYKMEEASCMVEILPGEKAIVLFEEPQFAPAIGQVAVIYENDIVLGGGYICEVF